MPDRSVKDLVLFGLEKSRSGAHHRAVKAAKDALDVLRIIEMTGEDRADLRDASEELVQRVHELNAYDNALKTYKE